MRHFSYLLAWPYLHCTKHEVFIKDFFNKCDQIRRKLIDLFTY